MFSVPVGEIKPQGVYDIPPTQGVSALEKHWVWMSLSVCMVWWLCVLIHWDKIRMAYSERENPSSCVGAAVATPS